MGEGKDAPILVVASDPARRRLLAEALAGRSIEAVAPEALRVTGRYVDAGASVVLFEGREPEIELGRLSPLRELPAAAALVLVLRRVDDSWLPEVLARLAPSQVLREPISPVLLRFAVDRVLPLGGAGRGARAQHRRAPALLGVSAAIRDVLSQVRRIAAARVPVLVLGETGTGKELVARALHEEGPRSARPFVALNCSAVPESLLESELFGFEQGAFTGATRAKPGLFVEADGGTLFLDEIGDMPLALQAKLLRALESGEVRPLGSTRPRQVDVRIVSATNRDLEGAVAEGTFREDLLYRVNTVVLHLPPLRRRSVDIPFLAQHFAEELGEANARRIVLAEDFVEALTRHSFPGNVRELRNAVERAIALAAPGEPISARHFSGLQGSPATAPPAGTLSARLETVEREAIGEALTATGGNRTQAAERLGISRLGLRKKMRRLGLEREPSR